MKLLPLNSKKLKPSLQIAQTECGLCCVRTLLDFFGYETSMTELRQVKEPGRDGLGIQQIKELLANYKISSKVFRVNNVQAFKVLEYPAIAFWKGYHFVCIESFSEKEAVIMDPSIGRMKISYEEFVMNFDNYILVAQPEKDFERRSIDFVSKWNKKYIWPSKMLNLYLKVAGVSACLVGMTLLVPIFTQYLIDNGFNGTLSFPMTIIALILTAFIMGLANYLRAYFSLKMIYTFSWHLLRGAFTRALSLPAKFFTVRAPGEIVYRLNSLNRIQDVLGVTLVQSCLDAISALAILIYVFWTAAILGILVTVLIISMLVFLMLTQRYVSTATDTELHEGTTSQSIQLDAIVSINSVKIGGYIQSYLKDWEVSFKKLLDAMKKRMRIQQGLIGSVLATNQVFSPLLILVVSLYLVQNGVVTIGQTVAIQSIVSLLFSYTNSVFTTFSDILVASRYIDLAEDIFEYPVENSPNTSQKLETGTVSLKNLFFSYTPDSHPAIKNISMEISDCETIALVGLSGSGKSTLGKVISSLFEPTDGELSYGDVDSKQYNIEKLRKSIGYIPQEAHLHNRTILENLKLGSTLSDNEIIDFCKSLKFLDFISILPMGYNTVISELGANLSGGQRQRIHVARVLLQTPKLLVLDEATSSLDNISQSIVYNELSELKCTKVVIAHRLATILNADRIFVLEEGSIVQSGTHEKLFKESGPYRDLFNAEFKQEERINEDYIKKIV